MFLAALTYHPGIGTFRGKRGAWRVAQCIPVPPHIDVSACRIEAGRMVGCKAFDALFMPVPRKLPPHTFVNPTRLLDELLVARRAATPDVYFGRAAA